MQTAGFVDDESACQKQKRSNLGSGDVGQFERVKWRVISDQHMTVGDVPAQALLPHGPDPDSRPRPEVGGFR